MFAGHPAFLSVVATAAVITQATPEAIAWGCLAARVLEEIVLNGTHPAKAVLSAAQSRLLHDDLLQSKLPASLVHRAIDYHNETAASKLLEVDCRLKKVRYHDACRWFQGPNAPLQR